MIIGKTTPIAQEEAQGQSARYTRRDHSISLRHSETGMVDQVSSYYLNCHVLIELWCLLLSSWELINQKKNKILL